MFFLKHARPSDFMMFLTTPDNFFAAKGKPDVVVPGVAQILNTLIVKNSATITADNRLNAIIIKDKKSRMKTYKKLIDLLDRERRLVEITAAIVDINVGTSLDWSANLLYSGVSKIQKADGALVAGSNASLGGLLGGIIDPGEPKLISSILNGGGLNASALIIGESAKLLARIHALETEGDAQILSRPSVLTVDNGNAILTDDTSFYVRIAGNEEVDLFKVTAGIRLRIKPHIVVDDDGHENIRLAINIEDGIIDTKSEVDGIPLVTKTRVSTEAFVGDGESLLIGGRYRHEQTNAEDRIPIIGRIPVLGLPFKSKLVENRKFQRMFIITPHIIDPNEFADGIASTASPSPGSAEDEMQLARAQLARFKNQASIPPRVSTATVMDHEITAAAAPSMQPPPSRRRLIPKIFGRKESGQSPAPESERKPRRRLFKRRQSSSPSGT